MAKCQIIISLFSTLLFLFYSNCNAVDLKACKFDQLYQLGDSFSDTGNYIRESPTGAKSVFARLPYGKSFSNKPTGRCSDGLLIIDYMAIASGIAVIDPFRNQAALFRNGDNFATAGATALPSEFLASKNIKTLTSTSLSEQLDFMFTHFNSICETDCKDILKNALFLVGEIGTFDYSDALVQGKTIQETTSLVGDVVFAIEKAINKVIEFGAVRIVVPGVFPLGCFPAHLTKFQSKDASAYDELGCLKSLNDLSKNHNAQLQQTVARVQKQQPTATIVYADYYGAYVSLLSNAQKFGFDTKNILKSCCGTGGSYNFDFNKTCGAKGVPVCNVPDKFFNWDGFHLTQRAYQDISQSIIADILPKLKC